MDYSDETPERFWITNPERHHTDPECGACGQDIDFSRSIPVLAAKGPMCPDCARKAIDGKHPLTVEYLQWLEEGDPRWWSVWICNQPCCMEWIVQ